MGTSGNIKSFAFTQGNSKSKPNEDAYGSTCDKGNYSFAVADGVSRSIYGDERYPACALPAAEALCRIAVPALAEGLPVRESFAFANQEIARVNQRAGIIPETVDYLANDYLCCEGSAGVLQLQKKYPKRFYYGYIGDCGILVYDKNVMPVFLSDNCMGILEQFRAGFGFKSKNDQRIFWRQHVRNRPESRYMTYGALTGETSALMYVKTGSVDLEKGDTVILFSDGISPFIFDSNFRWMIIDSLCGLVSQKIVNSVVSNYITGACQQLQKQMVGNLDDDKTFIALGID